MKTKKFFILFMSLVVLVTSMPMSVSATETEETRRFLDANVDGEITLDEFEDYTLPYRVAINLMGVSIGSPTAAISLADKVAESEAYQNFLAANEPAELVIGYLKDDDFFYFSDGVFDVARDIVEEEKTNNGIYFYPACSEEYVKSVITDFYTSGKFAADSYYSNLIDFINNFDLTGCLFTYGDSSLNIYKDFCNVTYGWELSRYSSSDCLFDITYELNSYFTSSKKSLYQNSYFFQWVNTNYVYPLDHCFVVGSSMVVFDTVADFQLYRNAGASVYVSSDYGESPSNVAIKIDTFNNVDWDAVNQATYNSVVNNITELESPTIADIQAICDQYFSDLQESLDILEEGNFQTNQSLDEILLQLTTDGERQTSWLIKIYNLLDEHLPISGSDSGSSSTGSSGDYTDDLEKIINLLEKNVDTLEDIERDTSQIKSLLAIDTTVNFFDLLNTKLSTTTETLKTKFPTSIPWDVFAVVTFMAEEPEAPVFDIPIKAFGFDETIHIDLSENSKTSNMTSLSKISRSILTITFILYLMVFTRNFTRRDD